MGFSNQLSDIGGNIGDTCTDRAFISDTFYNKILITKSWLSVIDRFHASIAEPTRFSLVVLGVLTCSICP